MMLFSALLQLLGTSPFPGHRVDPNRDPYGAKNAPWRSSSTPRLSCCLRFFLLSDCRRQDLLHGPGGLLLGCRGHMGIGVQGEPCREVLQHAGHRFHVHPVLECQGCERVPEIMEPDSRQSRPLQHPVEHMEHAARRDWAAGG